MSNTATRLINLIQLLQRRPNQKAADLAEELGISVRSLHRYFGMLDEMGIPVYSERGPYGGFSLVRGYRMPPLVLTPDEAVAVSLGVSLVEEMWGRLYREAARAALAKLENLLPDEQRREAAWARRSLAATGMHRADLEALAPILEKLRLAVREHRRVHLVYPGTNSPETVERDLDPYGLVHRWGWWYVIGYCHLRRALRTFRVDRIARLSLLETVFETAEGFSLRVFLANGSLEEPQFTACIRFIPSAARIPLDNRSYWEKLEHEADGSVLATYQAPNLEWAASMALAYGPLVEVTAPGELRKLVAQWLQEMTSIYNMTQVYQDLQDKME